MTPYSIQDFIRILEQKGCHITRNKLRHYEREGLVKPIRQKREQRDRWYYTDEDVDTVLAITNLISLSWKAKDVSALLKLTQEVNNAIDKMKKTREILFEIFKDNTRDIKDPAISEEIDFWKNFEGGFQLDNVLKIVEHYTKESNMNDIEKSTTQMLERMEKGVTIVSKYHDKISKAKEEISKLHDEIYHFINRIYNR